MKLSEFRCLLLTKRFLTYLMLLDELLHPHRSLKHVGSPTISIKFRDLTYFLDIIISTKLY